MSRKITLPIFVLFILFLVLYLLRGSLAMPIFERVLPKMMGADIRDELADGLNVGVCGAGGPLPDPQRSGACIAVMAGETLLVVDTGTGGARNITRMQIPLGQVDAVLRTHGHSDQIEGRG